MMLLHTLLFFLLALAVLIFVHELGHYWAARWCGVRVLRFSIGMGKVIFSRRLGPDQTEWALSILPLGGYVKMLDARECDLSNLSAQERRREFTCQSVWRRMAIVAAGPLANFILAITLFAALYSYGVSEPLAKLHTVAQQSVAYKAGLQGGELVQAVNGDPISVWSDLRWKIMQARVKNLPVELEVTTEAGDKRTVDIPLNTVSLQDLEGDFLTQLGLEISRPPAVIGKIVANGPAMTAGLQTGDVIQRVNGAPVADALAFVELIRRSPGVKLAIHGKRGAETFDAVVVPSAVQDVQQNNTQQKVDKTIGRIQAEITGAPEMATVSYSPLRALSKAVTRTWETCGMTLSMLGKMISGEASWKNITGPITIADYAGQTARSGLSHYLEFIALISISLGVMNLLPIPVLDGGLLLYYSWEILMGRPLSERVGDWFQRAGMGILMALISLALFNDIVRLFS